MSDQVFHQFENTAQSLPTYDLQFVRVRQRLVELPVGKEVSDASDAAISHPGCMRAIRSALAIEAATALMVYALWHLMRVLL